MSNKIFISHSSKNIKIINSFVDNILCNGLGLNRHDDLFCTSADGAGITSGEDFKLRIKTELEQSKAVIQILSPEYKSSEVCLNEMGAAWILNGTVIPFTVPPIGYDVGFIHGNTQQLRLNVKDDFLKFYDDHKDTLFTKPISLKNYLAQVDKFVSELEIILNVKDGIQTLFYDENVLLRGILKGGIFGGPPWGDDLPDLPHHRYYYLQLDTPINILTSKFIHPENPSTDINCFGETKLHVMGEGEKYQDMDLRAYENRQVEMVGTFMGGYTAWHQTTVLFRFIYVSLV